MLVDSHWPESVVISEWYFQPPTGERRPLAAAAATSPTPTSAYVAPASVSAPPVTASSSSAADHSDDNDNDNERTIMYHDGAASAAVDG